MELKTHGDEAGNKEGENEKKSFNITLSSQ